MAPRPYPDGGSRVDSYPYRTIHGPAEAGRSRQVDRAKLEPPTRRGSDRTLGTHTEGRKTPFKSRTRTIDPGRSRPATAHGPPTGRIVFTRPDGVPGRPDTDGKAESCTGPTGSAAGPVAGRDAPRRRRSTWPGRTQGQSRLGRGSDKPSAVGPQPACHPEATEPPAIVRDELETSVPAARVQNRRKTGPGRKGPDRIAIPLLARNVRPQRTIKSKKENQRRTRR